MMGLGAMIFHLGGGNPNAPEKYYNRKIIDAVMDVDGLVLKFTEGDGIRIWDNGQSCCEYRYMTCDDDVSSLIGGILRNIEDVPTTQYYLDSDCGYVHETAALKIETHKGFITVVTHNEHNGYYGGFGLCITEV